MSLSMRTEKTETVLQDDKKSLIFLRANKSESKVSLDLHNNVEGNY